MFEDVFAEIATDFSEAFGGPYYDGAVIVQGTPGHYDDDSDWVPGSPASETPCKVQIDSIDAKMRPADYTDADFRFLILASGFAGTINTDAEVEVSDTTAPADFRGTWSVSGLARDPAGVGWVGKGRKL